MSFVVKGIDLPKECRAVEITFYIPHIIHSDNIYINGRELFDQEISALFTAEHLNDIIQIQNPHGRVIDGGELNKSVHAWNPAYTYGRSAFTRAIDNAPTILAEE